MGEINREKVIAMLEELNPVCRKDQIVMYVDLYQDYMEADENIKKNGNIVSHPRTGSPIENPYLKIKIQAMNQIRKLDRVKKVGNIWD